MDDGLRGKKPRSSGEYEAVIGTPGVPRPTRRGGQGGFDTLVVGAGFAGAVLAERLASQLNQRVLVVDKRRTSAATPSTATTTTAC